MWKTPVDGAFKYNSSIIYLNIGNEWLDMPIFLCSMPGKFIYSLDLGSRGKENPQAFPHGESGNP
jgi:hypothetical protein